MLTQERNELIRKLDGLVLPHRAPLVRQLTTMPFGAVGRIATVHASHFAIRMGWTGSLRRQMFFGDRMRFPFPACWDLLVYRSYIDEAELRLMKFMLRHLPTGAQMIDVGANVGFFCLLASRIVGPEGRVHAFEPGQQALGYLQGNVDGSENVEIVARAAMDQSGEVTFYEGVGAAMVSSSTVKSHAAGRDTGEVRKVTILTTTLDDYCASTATEPTLIKVDVEGAELSVLRGGAKVLARRRPWIALEVSFVPEEFTSQYAPCVELLGEAGYIPHVIDADGGPAPVGLGDVADRGARCAPQAGYLHALDNILFVHPERPLV